MCICSSLPFSPWIHETGAQALEIMDSKDEASRSECWRHTWRVDVLTGDMEVPLCLMDSQLKPTLQTLVSDFYRVRRGLVACADVCLIN